MQVTETVDGFVTLLPLARAPDSNDFSRFYCEWGSLYCSSVDAIN